MAFNLGATQGAAAGDSLRAPARDQHVDVQALIEASLPGTRPDTAGRLAETANLRRVHRDETIFRQGEAMPLTLLLHGHGAFRRTTIDGQQVTVGIAYPGELFGISSIAATISSVDLVALTDGEVATWPGHEPRQLVAIDPGFALDIVDRLALFLSILTVKLDGFLHQDARRRVIRVLVRHRDLFFVDPPVLTRSHLPGLVGTSREMTGRVLRELEREGTIARVGRSGLTLLRPERLEGGAEQALDDPEG
jgi:CRP-like cAMP-binding protein